MKKILLVFFTLCPSLVFAGQHSGLGGGTPSKAPAPGSSQDSVCQDYLRWILEQIEAEAARTEDHRTDQPNPADGQ